MSEKLTDLAFLFVHGACHGAWCWRDVRAVMQAQGITTEAVDLPSTNPDRLHSATLDDDCAAIVAALKTLTRPTVLVAHSAGGFAATMAAEATPDQITGLAYICAYVPQNGQSVADMRRASPPNPALDAAITRVPDAPAYRFDPDHIDTLLYPDCPEKTRAFARAHLSPQAIAPQATKITLKGVNIPRLYVICDVDRVIPPADQTRMCADFPPEDISYLPCGHSPFFAMPDRLAARLTRHFKTP